MPGYCVAFISYIQLASSFNSCWCRLPPRGCRCTRSKTLNEKAKSLYPCLKAAWPSRGVSNPCMPLPKGTLKCGFCNHCKHIQTSKNFHLPNTGTVYPEVMYHMEDGRRGTPEHSVQRRRRSVVDVMGRFLRTRPPNGTHQSEATAGYYIGCLTDTCHSTPCLCLRWTVHCPGSLFHYTL